MTDCPSYIATIGFFDGVHIGHSFLLSQLVARASEQGLRSLVITFDRHPRSVIDGEDIPLLTTMQERLAYLRKQPVDEVLCLPFEDICRLTALEFMTMLKQKYNVVSLLMGYDHRFGSDRLRSFDQYASIARQVGLDIAHLPALEPDESFSPHVSSSQIRMALEIGDVEYAAKMLGHPYTITGTVVHGKGIGKQIGFPTANLFVPADKMLPLAGVYAVKVSSDECATLAKEAKAVFNVGTNPTIGDNPVTLEVHIPHFSGDLYGQQLTLALYKRIRDEIRFDSLKELKQQIQKDIRHL